MIVLSLPSISHPAGLPAPRRTLASGLVPGPRTPRLARMLAAGCSRQGLGIGPTWQPRTHRHRRAKPSVEKAPLRPAKFFPWALPRANLDDGPSSNDICQRTSTLNAGDSAGVAGTFFWQFHQGRDNARFAVNSRSSFSSFIWARASKCPSKSSCVNSHAAILHQPLALNEPLPRESLLVPGTSCVGFPEGVGVSLAARIKNSWVVIVRASAFSPEARLQLARHIL